MPPAIPRTTMICNRPCPAMDMMVNNRSRPGKAIQASTNLCTPRSSLPPMNPEAPPTRTATTTLRAVAARPTVSEIRAPTISRVRRSRPNWSVPSRYSADGPCILSSMFTSSYGKRVRTSAKIATKIKINTIIPLIVPSGFSLTSLTKEIS